MLFFNNLDYPKCLMIGYYFHDRIFHRIFDLYFLALPHLNEIITYTGKKDISKIKIFTIFLPKTDL